MESKMKTMNKADELFAKIQRRVIVLALLVLMLDVVYWRG